MKSPHDQRPDPIAREMTEEFIAKYARQRGVPAKDKAKKGKKARAKAKTRAKAR
jgi:hypothetical protein